MEYWTSRQIEELFLNAGFVCEVVPIPQHLERHLPADFVFVPSAPLKLFGIQYKALYHNGTDAWHLDPVQHGTLQHFPWIYYGFSELTQLSQARNSLHSLRLISNAFPYSASLTRSTMPRFLRWWIFFSGLLACSSGIANRSAEHLHEVLAPSALARPDWASSDIGDLADLFLVSFQTAQVWHVPVRGVAPEQG